ncbi:MAG: PAS domain-containing protein [Henriciella sp.]|nr:PAS domain-containing protein [Henriciella sp.]
MTNRITTGVAMVYMSTDFPGLTLAQAELIEHWRTCCHGGALPFREQLDPGQIRAHLSEVSIVEIHENREARFRLVGSGLRKVFGCDMRGRKIADLDQGVLEMLSLGLERSCEEQRPVVGLIERSYDTHAWLRLPLQGSEHVVQVLCHDVLIPNARLKGEYDSEFDIHSSSNRNLAA